MSAFRKSWSRRPAAWTQGRSSTSARAPAGPLDLCVSALTVHHLDGAGKADLFERLSAVLSPGGRFVLADVVVPDDPADAVTPLSPEYDLPSTVADQLTWLDAAGFDTRVTWRHRDLAVLRAAVQ